MTHFVKENLPDPIDRASELEMTNTEDAIKAVRSRNRQKQVPIDGVYPDPNCIQCDDEIPIGRLKAAANNNLCIICATAAERWRR